MSGVSFLNQPFNIGSLQLPHRLIQGPLAGYSCAPFRQLFYDFIPPAFCVSEMISAYDTLYKHQADSRYLYRAPEETRLSYQLSGHDPKLMAEAASRLAALGANLIDINCGCPKTKIRKKGAGSALLDKPSLLCEIVRAVRRVIDIPLTVKIRIQGDERDVALSQAIEEAGADALIVHGRRWTDDYDIPCSFQTIAEIKQSVCIPVIANGDMADASSLAQAIDMTGCDAYMIARAGCGNPWLYQQLLAESGAPIALNHTIRIDYFMMHLQGLARLESEHQAVLQSKTLVRYYFRSLLTAEALQDFYALSCLDEIINFLKKY